MLSFDMQPDAKQGLRLTPENTLERVAGVAEIHQALLMLLRTRPGERRLRPDFGCPLDRLVFEPNDDTTAGLAIRLVADAVVRHEPRARIDRLDAGPDLLIEGALRIDLDFTDRRSGQNAAVSLSVALEPTE